MIDNLACSGQIALVVVAKDAIIHEAGDEIVVTSKLEKFHTNTCQTHIMRQWKIPFAIFIWIL